MSRFAARNVSLLLMLAAFPLTSVGSTGDRPTLWWLGLASLTIGALIPPVMRYLPERKEEEVDEEQEQGGQERRKPRRCATDLGDSCRVC